MVSGMPIYEFRCRACGSRFEELVPVDGRADRCPECGAEAPERVFSPHAPAFHVARTPHAMRKQERKNAKLRDWTKARFKEARGRGREPRARASGASGSAGGDG